MGALKALNNQALFFGKTNNAEAQGRLKGKNQKNIEFKPKEEFDPSDGALGSNRDKHKRFENSKCSYCKKENHLEKGCMKKTIYQMSRIIEQHNISLLECTRKDNSG